MRLFLIALSFVIATTPCFARKVIQVTNSGGPEDFVYDDISGLQSWGSARDVTGNGSAGYSDGDPVSTVVDRSANAVNFAAAGSARPTFETSEINGNPCFRFDNANSQAFSAVTDDDEHSFGSESWTFVVRKNSSTNTAIQFIIGKDGTSNREWGLGHTDTDADSSRDDYFGFLWADSAATTGFQTEARSLYAASGQNEILALNLKIDGSPVNTEQIIYRNGSAISTSYVNLGAGTGWPAENLTTPMSVGGRPSLAAAPSYMQGHCIAEWLHYNGSIAGGDLTSIWSALNAEYAVY